MNARIAVEWVLIPVFCDLTGYTKRAVETKINRGKWIEGIHYRKAPDGHIVMNLPAYNEWAQGNQQVA